MESFVDQSVLNRLGVMTEAEADTYPFGIIKVTDEGIIQIYNKYESELAGVSIEKALGKNFFTQVAICTNNKLFYGRFKEGIQKKDLNLIFNYVFTYKMKPTNVTIHLYYDKSSNSNWIFVKYKGK
jgi:photoactive yellow protein